ncbi:Crp/Fnr family transcriptional regulator [Aquimarina sp. AU474]|uniref:Crp/Fnr family transcriptional regulator n=1 Tax=Aquimarina sp. AU474 TaxID=2108529 RepID=UPI000D698119|nr:Crp/Fnr family transcriptional regulator [Aquimarina sp. AU474]
MSHPITTYLKTNGDYSPQELELLKNSLEHKILEKDEFLLEKGEVCSCICFVESGAVLQYKINSDMDQVVIDLNISNDWVINHKSFTSQRPSEYNIKAFEKTTVYILYIESIHRLIAQSQSFLQMGKLLENAVSRIDFFDNNNTPDEKYMFLLKNKPEILQKFPQTLIASYLKITPETLSRVRKRLSKV